MTMVIKRFCRYTALFFPLLFASACTAVSISPTDMPSALEPRGPQAVHLASLWWVMFALGVAIFLLVIGLLLAALLRHRRATSDTAPDSSDGDTGRNWLIRGGIALPFVVLSIVFGYTMYTLAAVENPQEQAAIQVRVIARRWWWEIDYPGQSVTTANEIHIPVGVPVQFQLESADVIHSFWVPELHGKIDMIPGQINYLTLQADQPGVYRGQCAEYCGLQHALMGFVVVAQSRDDYNKWLAAQQPSAATPTDPKAKQGQQVFLSAGCVYCHTINGLDNQKITGSSADLGPDLTHFGSRLMIAGATLPNNTSNLAGWIVDAQHIKQGSDMPKMTLNPQDLQTLLAYLQSLR